MVELVGFEELSLLYEEMVEGAEVLNARVEQVCVVWWAPATIEHAMVNQFQFPLAFTDVSLGLRQRAGLCVL